MLLTCRVCPCGTLVFAHQSGEVRLEYMQRVDWSDVRDAVQRERVDQADEIHSGSSRVAGAERVEKLRRGRDQRCTHGIR